MKKKRHTADEIRAKLTEADRMSSQGMLQADIAKNLGVSVMTFHRWRKQPSVRSNVSSKSRAAATNDYHSIENAPEHYEERTRIAGLQSENARLRRLVTDLLLEKMQLEEALGAASAQRERKPRGA